MYQEYNCPRCSNPIPLERMLGKAVICSCGWSGAKSDFEEKKRKFPFKKFMTGLIVAGVAYSAYLAKDWGKYFPEYTYYQALDGLKMAEAQDHARMAFVCKSLEKHDCSAKAYTKALALSPQSHQIAGALGVELVKSEQYDQAILTFQNFFSNEDGSDVHKHAFAQALSARNYTDDATEWFYKALQANPKNFEAAQNLIKHLSKNELHSEALSVVGHYNNLFPKTRKNWKDLVAETKAGYTKYNDQYEVTELKISGINKYLHAPVKFSASMEPQIFMVNPESDYLTVDMAKIQELGVPFKDLGEKDILATNGRSLKGTQVVFPELSVGPFTLKNVKALACDGCAFLLGKKVMKRLNFKQDKKKGVNYITLQQ